MLISFQKNVFVIVNIHSSILDSRCFLQFSNYTQEAYHLPMCVFLCLNYGTIVISLIYFLECLRAEIDTSNKIVNDHLLQYLHLGIYR